MNKFIKAFCLTVALSVCAFAQATNDEYKKNEFFVGYSYQNVDRGIGSSFNGFEFSYVRNVRRYFGIKGDVSGSYRNDDFEGVIQSSDGINTTLRSQSRSSLYNFLGGVQVRDNASKARLKPFGHALAGIAQNRDSNKNSCTGNCAGISPNLSRFTFTDTGFAAALGGGLDVKINDRFDIRAIQADYNPVYNYGRFRNNFRFSIGLVFK